MIDSLPLHPSHSLGVGQTSFQKKCRVFVDYVQEDKGEYLKDEKGDFIEFERTLTALNYLENMGFTLISVNSGGCESINQFTHYLFRRKE